MIKNKFIFGAVVALVLLAVQVSASLNVSLSDQGTGLVNKTNGTLIELANLTVEIWDALSGGNLIYNETFVGEIVNGSWNVMLGENSSNPLPLEYGRLYYKDYRINGEDASFRNITGGMVGRQFFYSPLGDISEEDISSGANITTTGNMSANYGFFGYLGNLASRVTKIFVQDIDVAGDVNVSGNVNVTGNITAKFFVGDGSQLTGVASSSYSYNQSLVGPYAYNQTTPAVNLLNNTYAGFWYNMTGGSYNYNETAAVLGFVNNSANQLNTTYAGQWYNHTTSAINSLNSTYAGFWYNMSGGGFAYNETILALGFANNSANMLNSTYAGFWYNMSGGGFAYNETIVALGFANNSANMLNSTYAGFWYNMSGGGFAYNETIVALGFANNSANMLNSTYAGFWYNMSGGGFAYNETIVALGFANNSANMLNSTYAGFWYNMSGGGFAYNETIV